MSGAVPPPAARPLERAARVPQPMCPGCGGCGRVDPAPAPQRAPLRAGVARCGGGGRASPGGGAFHRCEGRLVSGAVPPPAARPLERAARVPRPVCPGCGRCGRVDPAPAPQRAPLRAGVARCGGGGRASPGGGAFHRCEGRLVLGAVPPPAARPLERAARVPVCVCVRVRALLGRVGRAGLPGAFWCASPFPLAALSFCFAWPPPGWGCPPLSRCPCRSSLPWRCALVLFLGLPLPGSSCARASFVSPAWPLAALWWFLPPPPPLLCLAVFVAPAWCLGVVVFFFFFFFFFVFLPCAPPLSPAFSCFRPRVPWASALCVFCSVGLPPLGSPCACPSFVLSTWLVVAPRRLLPRPPPPFLSRGFRPCRSVLCAVCCASLGAVLRRAAARCALRCCAVLCCVVLVGCRCVLRRVLWRCPLPWGPVLCGAAFSRFPRAVFVLSWRGGACCCSPLCFVLCVSRGAVLCVPCPLLSVRCCASLCWCARVVLFVWCVLLLAPDAVVCRGAVLGLLARGCPLVACFRVGVPVWPRGLFPCGWCGLLWCPAFLCRVLWCCAVAWCCAVVLCCRVAVLLGLALPSCGLSCCAVLCCWLAVLFFARRWWLRAVVLFSSCCAFPVFSALCAAVPCCAGCGALLPCVVCCGSVLSCGAVLSCSAVVLRCCLRLLCPPAARRAVACPCALCCFPGRSAVWWCCSGVSRCLAVLCVVLSCPAPCAVSCGAVPPCWVCFLRGCGCTYLKNRC